MSTKLAAVAAMEIDEGYGEFEALIRDRIASVNGPVFETDADPDRLWSLWLESLAADRRQHYRCRACEKFIKTYGGLVTIDANGNHNSVCWVGDGVPGFFRNAVERLCGYIDNSKVTGVFLWSPSQSVWGCGRTGDWTHLCGQPKWVPPTKPLLTPSQLAAEKREDYGVLCRSLADYNLDAAEQAVRVLDSDSLCRSEKAAAIATWFRDLHKRIAGLRGQRRQNLIWAAVATAPVGFCHVRSTVISTLLDDIVAGLDFAAISKRWSQKLHPLQYQRPSAPPSDDQIAAAEKAVAELGLAAAFQRRYATLDDVLAKLWVPAPQQADEWGGGIFDHLRSQKAKVQSVSLPETAVSWAKFSRDLLPTALAMEIAVPYSGNFYGLVTAADPAAPPLLQWDGIDGEARNPVSWYVYSGGSSCSSWRLQLGWSPVTAVFLQPTEWQRPGLFRNHGESVFFAIDGCRGTDAQLCIFPEQLKSSLHPHRAVIEAHSRRGKLAAADAGNANGLRLQKQERGQVAAVTVRLRTAAGTATYRIDRWD